MKEKDKKTPKKKTAKALGKAVDTKDIKGGMMRAGGCVCHSMENDPKD